MNDAYGDCMPIVLELARQPGALALMEVLALMEMSRSLSLLSMMVTCTDLSSIFNFYLSSIFIIYRVVIQTSLPFLSFTDLSSIFIFASLPFLSFRVFRVWSCVT